MKKIIFALIGIAVVGMLILFFVLKQKTAAPTMQVTLEETYDISKEYVTLRYRTDKLLIDAEDYKDYETWNKEMSDVLKEWEELDKKSTELAKMAEKLESTRTGLSIVPSALAYDKQEISNIFDNAPAGKKIATLAKHLGVDAKMAFKMLKMDQDQVTADAWNEAGDTFQKLETSATVIKDGCKIAGFVGGMAITGGAAGFTAASTFTKTAIVVSGVDLTLEVTDDGAKIALGNNNKVSSFVGSVRTVTEPLSSILTITSIPSNMATKFEKFSAVMVGLEQFNSAAQEGKIVGIELPAYEKENKKVPVKVAVMNRDEVEKWLTEAGSKMEPESVEEIEKILKTIKEAEEITPTKVVENKIDSIIGTWEGIMYSTPGQDKPEEQNNLVLTFNSDGTVVSADSEYEFYTYEKIGEIVRLYEEEKTDGYYEFAVVGDSLEFIKLAGIDSVGKWSEVMAGGDFFGGKFITLTLRKQ